MAPAAPAQDTQAGRGPALSLLRVVFLLVVASPVISAEAHEPADLPPGEPAVLCPAGFYRSPQNNRCEQCEDGVDFTAHPNNLPSCFSCNTCAPDEDEKYPCNRTRDTVCYCKNGTFRKEGYPEVCQKCQTKCPVGKVVARPCTPWSDLECVDQESGTKPTEEAPPPRRPVTSSPRTTTCPCPSVDSAYSTKLNIFIGFVTLILFGTVAVCIWKYGLWKRSGWRNILSRLPCTQVLVGYLKSMPPKEGLLNEHPTSRGRCCSQGSGANIPESPRSSESQDNDHNEELNRQASQPSLASEREIQQPNKAGAAGASELAPGEADCLLGPTEAKKSPLKRKKLIPARGVNNIEALRKTFCLCNDVNYKSWEPLMRELGLTANEIYLITDRNKDDPLHEMLEKWLNKTGYEASINTLLNALEKVGENLVREDIEKKVVAYGYFVYEEGHEADTVGSLA